MSNALVVDGQCTPCKNKWHKRYYTCYCTFKWETPTYRIIPNEPEISIEDLI